MEKNLVIKNFVLVGIFAPMKFDKFFFIKKGIFTEEEILPTSLFGPEYSLISSDRFSVQIVVNQIIVTAINPVEPNGDLRKIAQAMVDAIETNATAMGINFHYYIVSKDARAISKSLFYNAASNLNQFFDSDNTGYGYYLSKDFYGARLKLDMKPGVVNKTDTNEPVKVLSFQFNYHFDLPVPFKEVAFSSIENFDIFEQESDKIMSAI